VYALATGATDILVLIEALPEFIERGSRRLSANVEKNANVGLNEWTKSIEKPCKPV
jgi:hypothetical protein